MPALVVYGSKSPEPLREGSKALAAVLPDAHLRELAGVKHNVKTPVLVPLLTEFFAGAALSGPDAGAADGAARQKRVAQSANTL
jgi:hypothetical protein